jgi:hypothetical protein
MLKLNNKMALVLCIVFTGSLNGEIVSNFNYTGAMQTYLVPAGVTSITIEAWGAEGGESANPDNGSYAIGQGGLGGYSVGDLAVTPIEQFVDDSPWPPTYISNT